MWMYRLKEPGLLAAAYAVMNDGVGGGQDCIVILNKKRETNDRCNAFSFCNRHHRPVCTASPCRLGLPQQLARMARNRIGLRQSMIQPADAERSSTRDATHATIA